MKARTATTGVLIGMSVLACAHTPPAASQPLPNDLEAVAHALVFTARAAPNARVYSLEFDGKAAPSRLSARVATLARWGHRGTELLRDDVATDPSSRVLVRAGTPAWRTREGHGARSFAYAAVRTSYQVDGGQAVSCEVHVSPPADEPGWSMRTPSDVACWPKPQ
jgi:hypothetical protein